MKFSFLYTILLLSTLICSNNNNTKMTPKEDDLPKNNINNIQDTTSNPFKLHYDAVVVDTHNDLMMQVMEKGVNITVENNTTQSDLPRMIKGGLDVQVFSIYVPERYKRDYFGYVNREIDRLELIANNNPDKLVLVFNAAGMENELNKGKVIGLMGGEGGAMLEGSIDNLRDLYDRGLRYLGLTWNTSNHIATSARDEVERGKPGGLTDFGFQVITEMDNLGMMIDVSHLGETAFWDVIKTSKNPIIASHSCAYNLAPHYRNLKDEQIQAIAKSGGVIFINFYSRFLDLSGSKSTGYKKYQSRFKEFENNSNGDLIKFNEDRYEFMQNNSVQGGVSVDKLIEHIDYIVKLVGADHVGLGSDYDGEVYTPNELYDATCYPIITKKLSEKGYSETDIKKILGGNFIRVLKKVCK